MRLHSGAPFWLLRDGLAAPHETSALAADEQCEVLVVGAGITGALVADALTREGRDVVLIDKREPGVGSTAASTALLLYETDAELAALAKMIGEENAVRAYVLGREAIQDLESICHSLPEGCSFARATGLYLASQARDVKRLRKEVELRRCRGFDVEWLDAEVLRQKHGVHARGAIQSSGAATVDPLQLTRKLLTRAHERGARVYRGTTVASHQSTQHAVTVRTADGWSIHANRLVYATGYEIPPTFPRDRVQLHSTFALVTERPTHDDGSALRDVVIWESARPYAYLRATPDGRLMIGGRDAPFKNETVRDALLPKRTSLLAERLRALLPAVHRDVAFAWSGTFGESRDTLPYIGATLEEPRVFYALGYGGNGITFSAIASRIIADACAGRPNQDAELFALDR